MNYLKKFWKIYKAQFVIAACCAAFVGLSLATPRGEVHSPQLLEKIASLGAHNPANTPQSDRPGEQPTSTWVDLFSFGALTGLLKYRNQVKNIQGVAAGKTATIFLPTGPRYHEIILVTGDSGAGNGNAPTNAAIINEIRVIIGGKVIRRMTAAQLDLINSAMGANFASQSAVSGGANGTGRRHIPIFFAEPWRKRSQDQDALALQTGWLGSKGQFQIECDLQAAITPVLTAVAVTDNFDSGKPNGIMKWLANDLPAVGTPLEVATLDRADLWSQLSFFDTSDAKTIDRVRLVADGVELHDFSSVENTSFLKSVDMNPATGAYHVVFDHDDSLDDLLPAATSSAIQATLTPSAAANGTCRLITQRVGLPT